MKGNMRLTGLMKNVFLSSVFLFILAVCSCGGGGSSSSAATTGTANELGLPATGTATLAITGGSGTNSKGLPKLLKCTKEVEDATKSIRADTNDDAGYYMYFGDTNVYYFFYDTDTSKWYGYTGTYTYDSSTGIININNGEDIFRIIVGTTTATMYDTDGGDISTFSIESSFSNEVTMLADEGDEDNFDNTLTIPVTVNQLDVSFSGTTVTIVYNITVPSGKSANAIYFSFISPTLKTKLGVSEEYLMELKAVAGQYRFAGEGKTAAQTISGTFTKDISGAETGTWYMSKFSVNTAEGDYYENGMEVCGEYNNSTYYYRDDDTDKYKDTGIAVKTFSVSGGTPDTTVPTITAATISGTALSITASENFQQVNVTYVNKGHYLRENRALYEHSVGAGSLSASSYTVDLSSAATGEYYIAMITLTDAAGNSSVYFGYDTTVDFWSGDYSSYGLDLTKINRWTGEGVTATSIGNLQFTKP